MVFRGASTVSGICHFIVVLVITFFAAISCAALLSQAIRTSPTQSVTRNSNALIIGAAYGIVVRFTFILYIITTLSNKMLCLARRVAGVCLETQDFGAITTPEDL